MSKPKVLYNGNCPVCRTGVEQYRSIGNAESCAWVDVRQDENVLAQHGLTIKDVMYRVHYITEDGQVLRGIPAFVAIWEKDRRFRFLAIVLYMFYN